MQTTSQDFEVMPTSKEFSFEDFFHDGSGPTSPMAELQSLGFSAKTWSGPSLLNAGDISKKEAELQARGQFLGKREEEALDHSPYASTDHAEWPVDNLALEDRPRQVALLKLLAKCLVHQAIDEADLESLDSTDLTLLRSIVKRKYKTDFSQDDIDDKKKIVAELNCLDAKQKSSKRSEENNKLVFKRAIKFLITWYKQNRWQDLKDLRKKQYETMICQEFFSGLTLPDNSPNDSPSKRRSERRKIAQKVIISEDQVNHKEVAKDRDEKVRRFVITPQTINAKYIRFVFKSSAFKEFFDDFVANHFIADYRKNRPSKLAKIVRAVYSLAREDLALARDYVERNPKFKLPWTDNELDRCVASTRAFILRVFRQKHLSPQEGL